jgi:hypothetical protein
MLGGMTETYVTATDFRAHVAQITNCVAWRHDRAVVTRHGQEMGAYVCHEDLEFLRRYKPLKERVPSGDVFSPRATWDEPVGQQKAVDVPPPPDPDEMVSVEVPDPWEGPYEEVKRLHALIEPRRLESPEIMDWFSAATNRLMHEANLRSRSSPHSSD